jgi:anthranilate phosphoribosyltransferase
MQPLIARLAAGHELSPSELEHAIESLVSPDVEEIAKADFLTILRKKGETAGEIAGLARALLLRAVDPLLDRARLAGPVLDLCGTGGDRSDLFNVSTTCMFVVAAAGAVVVKHGNRAITSQAGGADVLEALGVRIDLPPPELKRCLEIHGLGFFFAPIYHPAFKAIAPVRRRLAAEGITTVFNLLGPLLNPAAPDYQLIGLYSREALPRYAEALQQLGRTRAWVIHGAGLDELTTCGLNEVVEIAGDGRRSFTVNPAEHGFPAASHDALRGGDRTANAAILLGILDGTITGPKRELVVLNSGAALHVAGLAGDLQAGFALAREQLESGRALAKLRALQVFA